MAKRLWIFGAGGHGKVVSEILDEKGFKITGFLDDDEKKWNMKVLNIPVLGGKSLIRKGDYLALGIGNNLNRRKIGNLLSIIGVNLINAISPHAIVSKSVKLDSGIMIVANATVNAGTSIGEGVILNTGCTIDHDCTICDYVHIAPGVNIAGNVTVGQNTFIGIGSCVIQGITIGNDCVIGAGCVILNDIPDNTKKISIRI